MASITKERKQIVLTKDELTKAGALEFNPKGVDLSFTKFNIPDALAEKMNAEIQEVVEKHLSKLNPLKEAFDKENGKGAFNILQSLHGLKVSVWSAKMQSRAARIMAVQTGKVPAELFEKDTVSAPVEAGEEMDIDLDI